MSAKKEKVEFVRGEAFEAVEDELGVAMNLLDETNARIAELLNSETRGDLPFINDTEPAAPPADTAAVAAETAPPSPATPA